MKAAFTFIFILGFLSAFAQPKQNIYFYQNNGDQALAMDSVDYICIVSPPVSKNKLYKIEEYYSNKKPKLIGESSTVHPYTLQGSCVTFYTSGKRQSISEYKDGRLVRDQFLFYPNGRLYQSLTYADNPKSDSLSFRINSTSDSTGKPQVVNGNGIYEGYNEDFTYMMEKGEIKLGLREGAWTGEDKNLKLTFKETYANGKLLNGTSTDSLGNTVIYKDQRIEKPKYPGGINAFSKALSMYLHYPMEAMEKGIQGEVGIAFDVDINGKSDNFHITNSVAPILDYEAIRAVKLITTKWIPGKMYGRVSNMSYHRPVIFKVEVN